MLILGANDIEQALTPGEVMEAVRRALALHEAGQCVMPDRLALSAGAANKLLCMPCIAEGSMTAKIVTVYPENTRRGLPMIDGVVLAAEQDTGRICALMDAKTITALRTAAVSGISIRHLAKESPKSVGLIGCGKQGFYHLKFACAVSETENILLYDTARDHLPEFIEKLRETVPGKTIEVASSPEELARASDIIIAATTAREPVFEDDPELFKGKHLIGIGAFEPQVREYPDALFSVIDRVWVDTPYAKEESGELAIPLAKGILRHEGVETLGHFIESGREPERGRFGTTFFKSVGMAVFDLTAASLAHRRAGALGIGTEVTM